MPMPQPPDIIRNAKKILRAFIYQSPITRYPYLVIRKRFNSDRKCQEKVENLCIQKNFRAARNLVVLRKQSLWSSETLSGWIAETENTSKNCPVMFESWRDSKTTRPQSMSINQHHAKNPVKAFQYWSQKEVPEEIIRLTILWNKILEKCGNDPIKIWSKEEARQWIEDCAPEYSKAFATSPHYAAESDVFRLAYTKIQDCMYIDADMVPQKNALKILSALLSGDSSAFFCFSPLPFIQNSFFVSRFKCPVFRAIRNSLLGVDYEDKEISAKLIHDTFGPGVYDRTVKKFLSEISVGARKVLIPGALDEMLVGEESLLICNEQTFARMSADNLSYKKTTDSWQIFCAQVKAGKG